MRRTLELLIEGCRYCATCVFPLSARRAL